MCDLDATGAPSIFNVIRTAAALARMLPTFDLSCEENAALENETSCNRIKNSLLLSQDLPYTRDELGDVLFIRSINQPQDIDRYQAWILHKDAHWTTHSGKHLSRC